MSVPAEGPLGSLSKVYGAIGTYLLTLGVNQEQ